MEELLVSPRAWVREAFCRDEKDPLRGYREEFYIPRLENGQDVSYFAGHSLGLQPKRVRQYLESELIRWREEAVEAHLSGNDPWVGFQEYLSGPLSRLTGGKSSELVVMNSLTTNLHNLFVSFYRPTKERYKILCLHQCFPSDRYALASQAAFHGYDPHSALVEAPQKKGLVDVDQLEVYLQREGEKVALIWFEGVHYLTGQALPIQKITELGHRYGCVVGFDLAHALGNLPLQLHEDGVDFAVFCTYKYLNGGPGCTGGAFVHECWHHREDLPRFAGWWGHDLERRFLMESDFVPTPGAKGWQQGNPAILPLACLRASLDLFDEVGIEQLREKSVELTGFLETLLGEITDSPFEIVTPSNGKERGCQLSLRFKQRGKEVYHCLQGRGIRCDWREPNYIRLAPVPFYNTFQDVARCAAAIHDCCAQFR